MRSSRADELDPIAPSALPVELVDRVLEAQGEILDLMAAGAPFGETLSQIATIIERLVAPAYSSILLMDREGKRLYHGAAPRLPARYVAAINGILIGPTVGSCGSAAFLGTPIIARDIETDLHWVDYRHLALAEGLRSCWSLPIKNNRGVVLGTFALYREEAAEPTAGDWAVLHHMARLVGVALAQHARETVIAESDERWRLVAEVAEIGSFDVEIEAGRRMWSDLFKSILGLPRDAIPGRDLYLSVVHPEDRAIVEATYESWQASRGNNRSAVDYRIIRPSDGETRWVNVTGCTLRDELARPWRRIGTCIDITERKLAEERLRASEAKVRRMQGQLQWAQSLTQKPMALRVF